MPRLELNPVTRELTQVQRLLRQLAYVGTLEGNVTFRPSCLETRCPQTCGCSWSWRDALFLGN
jgi:hypothetical protein